LIDATREWIGPNSPDICLVAAVTAACGGASSKNDGPISAALIIKTTTNPFFVALQNGAKEEAAAKVISLTGDVDSQVTAINEAIARGDKGS
jgi:fructose transport system substrate-binding protein